MHVAFRREQRLQPRAGSGRTIQWIGSSSTSRLTCERSLIDVRMPVGDPCALRVNEGLKRGSALPVRRAEGYRSICPCARSFRAISSCEQNCVRRQLAYLQALDSAALREEWRRLCRSEPPRISRDRALAYRIQELSLGGLPKWAARRLAGSAEGFAQFGERDASASASPSLGPGNRILRAETGGGFQAQNAGERPDFCSQTALRLANRPKLREFLWTKKARRFASNQRYGFPYCLPRRGEDTKVHKLSGMLSRV